jgi:hypothetical protein
MRRLLNTVSVLVVGVLGVPFVALVSLVRLKPAMLKYWLLGTRASVQNIWRGEAEL